MPVVQQTRGGFVEAEHPFCVAVAEGGRVSLVGEDPVVVWRSTGKPFQLAASVEALGSPDLPDRWLALGTASHSGQPEHVAVVREVLAHFGVREEGLLCGTHPPAHRPSADALVRQGVPFGPVHNNCSGKHAFMLAASAANGWDPDYLGADHPLQRRVQALVAEGAGSWPGHGVDGCGLPSWVTPLGGLARAWERVGAVNGLLGHIGSVLHAEAFLTSGSGRITTALVAASPDRALRGKLGGSSLYCVAVERGPAVAVWVRSADHDALAVATWWALAEVGVALGPCPWEAVKNVAGRQVGERRVVA